MTFHPVPIDRTGLLAHLQCPEWRTEIRCRGMLLLLEVGHITTDIRAGRVYTRGWYARIIGRGADIEAMRRYYARVEEVFGRPGRLPGDTAIGVRGYGRTREDAVKHLRRALVRGWDYSGALYAPPHLGGFTSEYDQ